MVLCFSIIYFSGEVCARTLALGGSTRRSRTVELLLQRPGLPMSVYKEGTLSHLEAERAHLRGERLWQRAAAGAEAGRARRGEEIRREEQFLLMEDQRWQAVRTTTKRKEATRQVFGEREATAA